MPCRPLRLAAAAAGAVQLVAAAAGALPAQSVGVLAYPLHRDLLTAPPLVSAEVRGQAPLRGLPDALRPAGLPLRVDLGTGARRWGRADWAAAATHLRDMGTRAAPLQVLDLAAALQAPVGSVRASAEVGYRRVGGGVEGGRVATSIASGLRDGAWRWNGTLELLVGRGRGDWTDTTRLGSGTPPDSLRPSERDALARRTASFAVATAAVGTDWAGVAWDLRAWQRLAFARAPGQPAARLEATLELQRPLTSRSTALLMFGNRSHGGEAPGPHASLGVRWRRGSGDARLAVAPLLELCDEAESGRSVLRVHAPGARVVELDGDPTGWAPQRMRRGASAGWWELAFPRLEGAQRVRLRRDRRAWEVPRDLPTERSEFEGALAVLHTARLAGPCR